MGGVEGIEEMKKAIIVKFGESLTYINHVLHLKFPSRFSFTWKTFNLCINNLKIVGSNYAEEAKQI